MTTIDSSKIFISGTFDDATVKVAANTTLKAGTVLGLNSSGEIVAYSTNLDSAYVPASGGDAAVEAFKAEPTYILANDIVNSTGSAVEYELSRVFVEGEVNASKLIFAKTADASDPAVLAALKNNGFILRNVQQACE